jgi:RNA polymerase sigma-70 factor (TIGR02960 family)
VRVHDFALDRARAGDHAAFADLTDPYRRELHLHCYRMLGSVTDAEDLLQETLTAAWRGLDGFAGDSSLRTWMYRIATHRCLNAIRDSKRRPPLEPAPPFTPPAPSRCADVTWLQPYSDAWLAELPDQRPGPAERRQMRETVELAFIAALQRLPPRQTAAVVLCEVLGFAPIEAAGMLDVTPTVLKGLLQRGRAALDRQPPARMHDMPEPGSLAERELARRFADAFSADDIPGVVSLLTDDAWLAMPPAPHEYQGTAAIAAFLHASASWRPARHFDLQPIRLNTQPAFTCTLADEPTTILVLTCDRDRICTVTRFLDPRLPSLLKLTTATHAA